MKEKILVLPQKKSIETLLTLPSLGWLTFFFTIPIALILTLCFKESSQETPVSNIFSLQAFQVLTEPNTWFITARTIGLALLATLLSVLICIPVAYSLARLKKCHAETFLLLIFIPSWSCFLVRIFAWKTLLHPDGFLKHMLSYLGLCPENGSLLYNNYAVLFAMIYSYAPFALLPLYNAAAKFNFQLLDASYDLGATRLQAIVKIFLPNIIAACKTAALLVLIPAAGAYIIPDLVGGTESEMLGNKIAQNLFFSRDIPTACVLSLLLACVILILARCISTARASSRYASEQSKEKDKK